MKKIYVCSPLRGDIRKNIDAAERYAKYVFECGAIPIVPHFFANVLDDSIPSERKLGMDAGLELLKDCDAMFVFGDVISTGMKNEIELCNKMGIPVIEIADITEINDMNNKMEGLNL